MNLQVVTTAYRDFGFRGLRTLARYAGTRAWTEITGTGCECPICGWRGRTFRPYALLADAVVRPRVVCPQCRSLERHRMSWLYFNRHALPSAFETPPDVVHISPDSVLEPRIRELAGTYRTSRYERPTPDDLHFDLHDIALPDQSVDVFVMNSVLSSIPDLARAMSSVRRVLRPGGVVISCEYLFGARTIEFGSAGYGGGWRALGRDDLDVTFAPLTAVLVDVRGALRPGERTRFGLNPGESMVVLSR